MRRIAFLIISLVISFGLLYYILRDLPLDAIAAALQEAQFPWILASLLSVLLAIFTRAIRWRGLLGNRLAIWDSFLILSLSFLLNQLPFRLGELARIALVRRRNVPMVTAATSIVVERLLDTLTVVLLIAWAISQVPNIEPQVSASASFFGVAAVIGFSVLLIFAHFPQLARRLSEKLPFSERLRLPALLENLLEGLHPLTNWRSLAFALLWTLMAWSTSLLSLYSSVMALGLPPSPIFLALGMGLSTLSIAIPTTLAGIGLIEGAIQLTGSILQFDSVQTAALGFLYHGLTILGYLLMGIPSIWLLGFSLNDLFKPKPPD